MTIELVRPAPPNVEHVTSVVAKHLLDGLHTLKLFHQSRDGQIQNVRFTNIELYTLPDGRAYGIYHVDVHRLPLGVTANDLTSPATAHHLGTVAGFRLKVHNTVGVRYIVQFHEERTVQVEKRLPKQVTFDAGEAPESSDVQLALGHGVAGPVWVPLTGAGHVLMAGATRTGKSTGLHAMIAGIALTQSPEACQIAHIDPKGNEAAIWTGLPHLFAPAATSIEAITGLAQDLVDEMERRGLLLAGRAARSITSYNTMMLREGGEPLPWLVVVIDEFVDLITQTGLQSALAKSFTRLANKANGFGITLIFAATNPRGDVVDGLLRANCPIRIAYSVPDKAISRAILGKGGAEAIAPEQKGRQIARLVDGREHLIQGYFLDDAQLQRVSAALCHREQTQPQNASVLSELELALIDTAERELDGVFAIGKLFAKHGAVISKVKIADLANRWERKGWLTAHNGGAMGRRLTPQLLEVRNRVRAAECNRAPRWDKVSTSTLHNQSLPFATRREATVQR